MSNLSLKEFSVAHVMADLLLKGTPETRIAKYLIEQGMTQEQVDRLLAKLDLSEKWMLKIRNAYRNFGPKNMYMGGDDAQRLGGTLKKTMRYTRK